MTKLNATRRQFLRTASVVSGSVGAAAAPFALNMATLNAAVAQSATTDYKAIVCMFFYGGNDSSNMVLRTDTTSFAEYSRLRATAPDSIALLAPGTAPNGGATRASPARLGGVLPLAPTFAVSPEIKWLPGGGAQLICADSEDVSESILFPVLPHQSRGLEDMRLVRLVEPDGGVRYLGT